jgi:hypothetical protein
MTTLLDIDPDILAAAEALAKQSHSTPGQVLSDLARKGMAQSAGEMNLSVAFRNGFEILPAQNRVITPDLIEKLMAESEP